MNPKYRIVRVVYETHEDGVTPLDVVACDGLTKTTLSNVILDKGAA